MRHKRKREREAGFGTELKTQTGLERSVPIQLGARYDDREKIGVKPQWRHNILKINIYLMYM